ncbi:MAG: glycosyltransferase family 2 protein [Terriglobales bacterium]
MRHYSVPAPHWNEPDGNRRVPLLSVIVPCKNEAAVLRETHSRLVSVLQPLATDFEIVYVDDGSTDSTFELLREIQCVDQRMRIVQLSRNFGHQIATTAGLEHASGDAVILIDADLQDPPEVIPLMVEQWRNGFDVAYGLRTARDGETLFKLWTARAFYRAINCLSAVPISVDTGDFRLMDRKVVNALLRMPEQDRFLRGMINWLGFRQVGVPYRRAARRAGETKYPLLKMLRFAMDGIASFSVLPLKMATWLGFSASGLAMALILYAMCVHAFTDRWVAGWTSLFVAVLFMGGAQLIGLGIIGEYIGRIYGETKRRPLYLVQELLGFDAEAKTQQETARAG